MKAVKTLTIWLLVIGGLNWGLYGLWNMDLVEMLLGTQPMLAKLVYALIGVSALLKGYCLCCSSCDSSDKRSSNTGCCSR